MNDLNIHNDTIIRDYKKEDYHQIVSLWEMTDLGNPVRGDDEGTIKRTIKAGGKLIVMELRSSYQIIGTSWMTYDGRRIMLHHFGILPDYQGKGLSNILLKESLRWVKEKGVQVKLEVHSSNQRAINLYQKFGFNRLGEYNVYIIRDISKLLI